MNMTHTKKHENSTPDECKEIVRGVTEFWNKESIHNIAAFCSVTRYALDIISPTKFRLIKE